MPSTDIARPYNGRTINWTGYLFYNGYRFPPQIKLRVETVPMADSANRATKYVQYTFYVDFIVTYEDWVDNQAASTTGTCDDMMTMIRRRLTQTGCEFKFNGQGFGGLWVNRGRGCGSMHTQPDDTSSTAPIPVVDATFGPHPQIMVCEPLGSNKVWRVTWSCTVTVPECCETGNNPYAPWNLYELTYDQSWTIDEQGMTIRTTTATVEMPGYRMSGGVALLNMVDKYREVLFPLIPAGFLRTQTYSMDRAKRKMEIIIIDREVPSDVPFWPNTANMSIVFSIDGDPWGANWSASCSGSITLAPGVPKFYAFSVFAALFLDRFNRGNIGHPLIPLTNENGEDKIIQGASILRRVSFTEDIFSRTVTFDFEWDCVTTLPSLFESSGMLLGLTATTMNPDPRVGWATWHTSVWNNMQNQRGYAQLNNHALIDVDADDNLNTICDQNGLVPLTPNGARYMNMSTVFTLPMTYTKVSKEHSYMQYQYSVDVVRESNVAVSDVIQSLQSGEVTPNQQSQGGKSDNMINSTSSNPANVTVSSASPASTDQTTQLRGPARYFLILAGIAVRVGFRIPLPKLLSVKLKEGGTAQAVLLDVSAPDYVLHRTLSGPVYGKQWRLVYQLPGAPDDDTLVGVEHDGVSMVTIASLA
jgi:hypothetical protein